VRWHPDGREWGRLTLTPPDGRGNSIRGDAVVKLDLTWDATSDIAYLVLAPTGDRDQLGPTLLLEADPEFHGVLAADFTVADGRLVGLEFQMASDCLPPALLLQARRIDGEHLGLRMEERILRRLRSDGPGVPS
jgi:uncharacterized protein YuzE